MTSVSNVRSGPAPIEAIVPQSPLVTADPNRIEYAKDSNGRRIGVKKLNALAVFELSMLLGEHAGNSSVLNQGLMAASVVEIDGDPVARPTSMLGLKAMIARLDFPGYTAVTEAMNRYLPAEATNKDALKKLTRAADFAQPILLMSKGIPEFVAFGMSPDVRLAAIIVLGEAEGGTWDWSSMNWQRGN